MEQAQTDGGITAPHSAPAWYNYWTPPPRRTTTSRKRSLLLLSPNKREQPDTHQDALPLTSPPLLAQTSREIPVRGISTGPATTAEQEQQQSAPRTGLFRRLRTRRARRLAEYEQATMRLPSPPSSGNHQHHNVNTRQQQQQQKPRGFRCIPADHPCKVLWDTLTVFLSLLNAYYTHVAIRDRRFDVTNHFKVLSEIWFLVDILLNFATEHRIGTVTLKTVSAVSARYLTTWFAIDLLSLVPGEVLYVRPVIEQQRARGLVRRWFFRTKSVGKVTGKLLPRWRALRQFGALYKRHRGVGGVSRLIRRLIKYLPKYVLFLRHMKGVIAVRLLRQVHWFRKVYYNFAADLTEVLPPPPPHDAAAADDDEDDEFVLHKNHEMSDDDTFSMTYEDDDGSQQFYYWEELEDDDDDFDFDDGVPY